MTDEDKNGILDDIDDYIDAIDNTTKEQGGVRQSHMLQAMSFSLNLI